MYPKNGHISYAATAAPARTAFHNPQDSSNRLSDLPLPRHPSLIDHEYVRYGVACIFLEVEPLGGRRHVKITERRAQEDWAAFIRGMLDERYPDADKEVLVMDNLNTHTPASLYQAFPPEEARRLTERLEIHYTPKHGSWLDIAEIELSILIRQWLSERTKNIDKMRAKAAARNLDRNNRQTKVNWQFTCLPCSNKT